MFVVAAISHIIAVQLTQGFNMQHIDPRNHYKALLQLSTGLAVQVCACVYVGRCLLALEVLWKLISR